MGAEQDRRGEHQFAAQPVTLTSSIAQAGFGGRPTPSSNVSSAIENVRLTVCPAYGVRSTIEFRYACGLPHQPGMPCSGLLPLAEMMPSYGSVRRPSMICVWVAPLSVEISSSAP